MAAASVMQPKDVSFASHFYVYTVILPNLSFVLYKCIHPICCRMQPNSYSADRRLQYHKTHAERECVDWKQDK